MNQEVANWFKDERAIVELHAALSNEYVRKALSIVLRAGLPAQTETPAGVNLLEFGALANASREGYFQAIKNLEALAAPLPSSRAVTRPWEYLLSGGKQPQETTKRKPRRKV